MEKRSGLSLVSRGLKYKLRIAFLLMSILPLLMCVYLVANYIFPQANIPTRLYIYISILISAFVAIIGFFVVKEIIYSILSVSAEAKRIAAGDVSGSLEIMRGDEVGDLACALNELTQRIRSNMGELRNYSERTTEINMGIQRRILVLSSLLQISALISQGSKLEDILKFTTEKSRFIAGSDVAFVLFREEETGEFLMKTVDGVNTEYLLQVKVELHDVIFNELIKNNTPLMVDAEKILPEDSAATFYERFKLKNILALPLYIRGKVVGIFAIGNNQKEFSYKMDDIELLDVFVKQIAIAMENDMLLQRVEKLEIKDALTGLYNEMFIHGRLQEEIKRAIAYHRPCSFVLLNIDDFQKFHQSFGELQAESVLKKVASLISESVTDIERVARFGDNEFVIVLPEKNKRQAKEIAENIRKKIESTFSEEQDVNKRITVSGGVSENPLDGINAEELIGRAKDMLNLAKDQGKNRVII